MPEEPPSILPRGTIIRPSARPRPTPPASPVYIQSVSGFICSDATAAGMDSSGGGGPPASTSATRTDGSSDSRAAITAPADPPPTTTTSNCCSATGHLPGSRPHPLRLETSGTGGEVWHASHRKADAGVSYDAASSSRPRPEPG